MLFASGINSHSEVGLLNFGRKRKEKKEERLLQEVKSKRRGECRVKDRRPSYEILVCKGPLGGVPFQWP